MRGCLTYIIHSWQGKVKGLEVQQQGMTASGSDCQALLDAVYEMRYKPDLEDAATILQR